MIGETQSENPWDLPPEYGGQRPGPDHSADYSASITAWYQQYLGRTPSQGEIDGWLQGGTPIQQIQGAIANSPEAKSYAASQNPTQPPGGQGNPGGGGGGPAPNVGGLVAPFGGTFSPPTPSPYPNAPTFTPPTMGEAANDPGYVFTLNQGKKNLESWLAAHGTFNDSSAAEALQQYGQGAASTQYNNVWNRAYQGWQGSLQPWQTQMSTTQHDNDMHWQEAFNTWLQNWNVFKDQRDSTFDKRYKVATS